MRSRLTKSTFGKVLGQLDKERNLQTVRGSPTRFLQLAKEGLLSTHLSHDRNFLQKLLILAGIILHLFQDLHCYFLPTIIAAV